jgi:hypothetical protein
LPVLELLQAELVVLLLAAHLLLHLQKLEIQLLEPAGELAHLFLELENARIGDLRGGGRGPGGKAQKAQRRKAPKNVFRYAQARFPRSEWQFLRPAGVMRRQWDENLVTGAAGSTKKRPRHMPEPPCGIHVSVRRSAGPVSFPDRSAP